MGTLRKPRAGSGSDFGILSREAGIANEKGVANFQGTDSSRSAITSFPFLYPQTCEPRIRFTILSKDDERSLGRKVNTIENQRIKAGVYGFKVVEYDKRCRPVWDDEQFSNFKGGKILLHKHSEIAEELQRTSLFLQVDGKSMYDQFELSQEVQAFFGFKTHDGTVAALATLPAGFQFAPGQHRAHPTF